MYVADPIPLSPSQTLSAYASPAEIEQATQALAQALQASAAERDRSGGHAAAERELIRVSGLLNLTTPRATLRTPLAQLILTNLYVGIARGALEQALRYTRDATRPPVGSGVARAVDDPYIQQRYGQLTVLVRPAEVLADVAAQAIDQALDRFWRNARVHTLHDPIDYKLRDLGRHALTGEFPVPSSYA